MAGCATATLNLISFNAAENQTPNLPSNTHLPHSATKKIQKS